MTEPQPKPDESADDSQPMTESQAFPSDLPPLAILEQMPAGLAYCRMVYRDGEPSDFVYLYTNPAFHAQTGLGPVQGKAVTEVIPGIRTATPALFETYGRVAAGGHQESLEIFLDGLGQWFSVQVFSPLPGHFAAIFNVVNRRKEAEQALKEEANLRLQAVVRASNVGLWDWDLQTNQVRYSAEWKSQLGYAEHELSDSFEEWRSRVHPDDLGRVTQHIQQFMENPTTSYEAEFRLLHRNGSYRHILAQASLLPDAQGRPHRLLGSHIDITEHKRIERALSSSESRLRLFIEHAPVALAMFDSEMRYLEVSRRWLADYGLQGREILGLSHYDVFPDIPENCRAMHRQVLAGEVVRTDQDPLERLDGTVQWLRWEARPWRLDTGEVGGIILFTEDITQQRQATQELDRMRLLMQEGERIAHLGTWEYIAATQETVWSDEECRIHGVNPAQPSPDYRQMLRDRIHPDDAPRLDRIFGEALQNAAPYEMEHRIVRPDGSVRVVRDLAHPYFDAAGHLAKYIGTTLDITEIRRQEQRERARIEILEAIATGKPLAEVLDRLVKHVESEMEGAFCSILLMDDEGKHLWLGAAPSLPESYNRAVNGLRIHSGAGSCGTAACENRRVIVADIPTHPYWTDFREAAAQAGLASCWSEPIRDSHGKVLGTFAIYHQTPRQPDEDDLKGIDVASRLSGIAIELNNTQRSLHDSQARLQAAIAASQAGFWEWDLTSGRTVWSDKSWNLMGLAVGEHEPSYETWRSTVRAEDIERLEAIIHNAVAQGIEYEFEWQVALPGGEERWLLGRGGPLLDTAGQPERYLGLMIEVTERKRLEREKEARYHSEQRLGVIMEQSMAGVVEGDLAGCLIAVNDRFCDITGYSRGELVGLPWTDLTLPEDRAADQSVLVAIRDGKPCFIEKRYRRKDGDTVWVNVAVGIIKDDAGTPQGTIAMILDISERKAAEMRTLESERRFRELFEHLPIAYQSLDIQGRWLDANGKMAELLGFDSPESMLGLDFIDYWDDSIKAQFEEAYDQFKAKQKAEGEINLVKRDGSSFTVQVAGRIQRDNDGQFLRTHCVLLDITERRRMEEDIRTLNAELEQKVLARTEALRRSDARSRQIFEASTESKLLIDGQGIIVESNRKAGELFRCPPTSLIGRSVEDFVPEATRAKHRGHRAEFGLHPSSRQMSVDRQVTVRACDGALIPVEIGLGPVEIDGTPYVIASLNDISLRVRAERAFQESRETLQHAQSVAHIGSWRLQGQSEHFEVSLETARLFDLENDQSASFVEWFERVHPDDRAAVESAWQAALLGAAYDLTYRIVVRGEVVWIRALAELAFDENGSLLKAVGTVQDITSLKLARIELERQEHLLQTILDNSPTGLALFDERRKLIKYNQQYADLMGYPPGLMSRAEVFLEDLLRYGWERGDYAGDTLEAVLERFVGHFEVRQPVRFIRGAWNGKTLEIQGIPLVDHWTLLSYSDITPLREAEAQMQRTMQRLKLATEAADLGIWNWNLADDHLEWDHRLRAWYETPQNIKESGLYYPFWHSRLHSDDVDRCEASLMQAVSNQSAWHEEFRIMLPGGRMRHIQAAAVIEKDADGKPIGMIGINRDISEQRGLEHSLIQAKSDAEAANHAKGDFLANMSHELRSPMNAIIGLTGLILDTDLTPKQRDHLGKVRAASKALLRLLNDILDYSKIEAGHMEIEQRPFALAETVRNVADLFTLRLEEKELAWRVESDPSLPRYLVGDDFRLSQVLINLIGNAVKFTEHGGVSLLIEPVASTATGTTIRFTVRDTGIGIRPDQVDRLFTSFTQADTSMTRKFGGTGLGLSISKRLVELMGGGN